MQIKHNLISTAYIIFKVTVFYDPLLKETSKTSEVYHATTGLRNIREYELVSDRYTTATSATAATTW